MNGLRFIEPGLFDRRAILEEDRGARDALGGQGSDWREVAELSIHLEPTGERTGERFDRIQSIATHRVTMRHREGVRAGMAFRLGLRRLVIQGVRDPDGRHRHLVCRCEEEA